MTERDVFLAALEFTDPAERDAYVVGACGGDADLCHRVRSLLLARDGAGSFLERPALDQMHDPGTEDHVPTPAAPPGATAPPARGGADQDLSFLTPPTRTGALGRLEHYEVLSTIGRGGMGIVLKAYDENLQRVVAIKVMAPQLATSAQARKRFLREAQAAAAVSHDHVITIHAVGEFNGVPYLVMNCVGGVSLQEKLDRAGPLGLKEILRIGLQTAQGLGAAHAQGLVHRDVKPANILLENGVERVKLTDFGLARAADDASLTQSGVITGTPQYMSPEQAEGCPVDHRSDLFSLGSVLYAMCTGRPPFRAETTLAVLKRVCEDTPRPIQELNPDLPPWLGVVVEKLQAKDPRQRYASAKDVADDLARRLAEVQQPGYVFDSAAAPRPTPSPRPTTAQTFSRALALCSILIMAGMAACFTLRISPTPWAEWAGGGAMLLAALVALSRHDLGRRRWAYAGAPALLALGLVGLGVALWPVYTGRFFNRLILDGHFTEAGAMMPPPPNGTSTFEPRDGLFTLHTPQGLPIQFRPDGATLVMLPERLDNTFGFLLHLADQREVTAQFHAVNGTVYWKTLHLVQHGLPVQPQAWDNTTTSPAAAELERLLAIAREQRDLAELSYNAGRIAIHEYLDAQIRYVEAQINRDRAAGNAAALEQSLTELVGLWTRQHATAKQRYEASVIRKEGVNAAEAGLINAQSRLRQVREERGRPRD